MTLFVFVALSVTESRSGSNTCPKREDASQRGSRRAPCTRSLCSALRSTQPGLGASGRVLSPCRPWTATRSRSIKFACRMTAFAIKSRCRCATHAPTHSSLLQHAWTDRRVTVAHDRRAVAHRTAEVITRFKIASSLHASSQMTSAARKDGLSIVRPIRPLRRRLCRHRRCRRRSHPSHPSLPSRRLHRALHRRRRLCHPGRRIHLGRRLSRHRRPSRRACPWSPSYGRAVLNSC